MHCRNSTTTALSDLPPPITTTTSSNVDIDIDTPTPPPSDSSSSSSSSNSNSDEEEETRPHYAQRPPPNPPSPNSDSQPPKPPLLKDDDGETTLAWESCGRITTTERADFFEFATVNLLFACLSIGGVVWRSRRMRVMHARMLAARIGLVGRRR